MRVAVSLGDPSGVGPEVAARALLALRRGVVPLAFGDASFAALARKIGLELPVVPPGRALPEGPALVAVTRLPAGERRPGVPSPAGGAASLAYLEAAFAALSSGRAQALCTAPLSKAQVARTLPGFVGHTEWLEARGGGARSVMMLAGRRLRVTLVSNHVSLREAIRRLTPARIAAVARVTADGLRRDLGIDRPRIAVAALNPHAGEGGAFGDEEGRLVAPAVESLRAEGIDARGPFPPDSVFFRAARGEFDAVVSLHHDQGLIPVKLMDALMRDPAVNVTLGLPFVRTSPDHGVAWDLAGTGRASDASMRAALRLAASIARRRVSRGRG
ncbi:MAG TPA: 4-hydroxythreonine-4-phosphate dehydrogenase PdxA [Anaeromyxobacteraceae bacterium]|nr:4-hydroxythreonine-4-phosphate dehydrogenase PdxA [Anaeromyxobacteraceae bacterium]